MLRGYSDDKSKQIFPGRPAALKWLQLLMNHIPDKYQHLVRYYGYYSNRSPGARRTAKQNNDTPASVVTTSRQPTFNARPTGLG